MKFSQFFIPLLLLLLYVIVCLFFAGSFAVNWNLWIFQCHCFPIIVSGLIAIIKNLLFVNIESLICEIFAQEYTRGRVDRNLSYTMLCFWVNQKINSAKKIFANPFYCSKKKCLREVKFPIKLLSIELIKKRCNASLIHPFSCVSFKTYVFLGNRNWLVGFLCGATRHRENCKGESCFNGRRDAGDNFELVIASN
jgi:hypothetical protein